MLNHEELKNLSVLIQRVDLKGNEAMPVAILQQKIAKLMQETPSATPMPEETSETKGTE